MKMYSIHDSKGGFYSNPFYARQNGEAIRSFMNAVDDPSPNNLMHRHPADYSLFEIGSFDDLTGVITPIDPKHLCNGVDIQKEGK